MTQYASGNLRPCHHGQLPLQRKTRAHPGHQCRGLFQQGTGQVIITDPYHFRLAPEREMAAEHVHQQLRIRDRRVAGQVTEHALFELHKMLVMRIRKETARPGGGRLHGDLPDGLLPTGSRQGQVPGNQQTARFHECHRTNGKG